MALPSGITLASAAAVVAAGVWLAASGSSAGGTASAGGHPSGSTAHATRSPQVPVARRGHGDAKQHARTRAVPRVLVDVYNNSGVQGLAGSKAALLRGAGWDVAGADDWYGDIPADTVYYPPRLRPAARELAAALGVHRLRPAVTPMQFDRLTVIFTAP